MSNTLQALEIINGLKEENRQLKQQLEEAVDILKSLTNCETCISGYCVQQCKGKQFLSKIEEKKG